MVNTPNTILSLFNTHNTRLTFSQYSQYSPLISQYSLQGAEDTGDELEDDKEDAEELKIQQMTEPEQKGYKDWLAAAAQDIVENEDVMEIMSPMSEEAPSLIETVEELTEEQKKTRSKANKILDKLRGTEGAELKKVLFSLKTFFQEDKNLVADFIEVCGLKLPLTNQVTLKLCSDWAIFPDGRPGPACHPWQGGRGAASELYPQGPRADHALRGRHAGRDAAHSGE